MHCNSILAKSPPQTPLGLYLKGEKGKKEGKKGKWKKEGKGK